MLVLLKYSCDICSLFYCLYYHAHKILCCHIAGGIEGPKPVTSGGIGSFKVGSKGKGAPNKKEAPNKKTVAKKTNNKKAPVEEKKKVGLWIKTPWSK